MLSDRIDPKGIIFDFDNTLVDTNRVIWEAYDFIFSDIAIKFNVDKNFLFHESRVVENEAIRTADISAKSYDHGVWIGTVVNRLNIPVSEEEINAYRNAFYSYVTDHPRFSMDTESVLKAFKAQGKKLALLSEKDAVDGQKAERINKMKFSEYFDVIVIAGETIPFRKVYDGP